ncbi:hypothetical protein RHSIM_Rhsim10G0140500 [Rhododendron simsii]|uniref:Uncharacterized protein n=1 Tax=Rhododendron simsii TaxID=118357 RepID=A0A834GHN3_RHOSS|nr:hypothetical protein RHSIM_Rhsim10G0140500 [Rhododendron simsii]
MNGNKLISSVSEGKHSTGLFYLAMQGDGHLVSYPLENNGGVQYAYWASGTFGAGNNITLNLDDKGLLYLLNETGGNTIKNLSAAESSNDGKIYRMTFDARGWNFSSLFAHNGSERQLHPLSTRAISYFTTLSLISGVEEGDPSTGLFRLKMQEDGHLVSYLLQSLYTTPYAYCLLGI